MPEVAYTVDLLFSTDDRNAPGSLHVKVMSPTKETRLSAVVEVGSGISIKNNIGAMIESMQKDIFDRIKTDVRKDINLYFSSSDEQMQEFDGSQFVKLIYTDENSYQFEQVDKILY